MKQSITFLLIAIGWMTLFNSIILNSIIQEEPLITTNLITGATVTKNISLSPQAIGKIIIPLAIANVLMIALLIMGYKTRMKNSKIKFEL